MTAIVGNCIQFTMEIKGKIIECRLSKSALLQKENIMSLDAENFLTLFEKRRVEIQQIAYNKYVSGDKWLGGVWVTTGDFH